MAAIHQRAEKWSHFERGRSRKWNGTPSSSVPGYHVFGEYELDNLRTFELAVRAYIQFSPSKTVVRCEHDTELLHAVL